MPSDLTNLEENLKRFVTLHTGDTPVNRALRECSAFSRVEDLAHSMLAHRYVPTLRSRGYNTPHDRAVEALRAAMNRCSLPVYPPARKTPQREPRGPW